jgi:hypothetical protein
MEKFDEAERGYRRAHAIAVASLAPRHPFVATSLKNLVDFCVARGIPLWTPPTATPVAEVMLPGSAGVAVPPVVTPTTDTRVMAPPADSIRTPRVAALAALVVGSLAAVMFIASWRGADESAEVSPQPVATSATQSPASVRPSPPIPASAVKASPATPSRESNRRQDADRVARDRPVTTTEAPPTVTVLTAQVCSALDRRGSPDWACTPVSGVGRPGALTFYTRLLSGSDTAVEHRWYYGDRLHQTMRLNVRGSRDGYRTYSRNTVAPGRTGEWKVELRASDGSLLQEEHFVIR